MEAQEQRGPQRFWRMAARLAWRDLSASPLRPALVALTMALSIASVGGVRGAARVALDAIHSDSKVWLGGDLAVDTWDTVDESVAQALAGTTNTLVTWTMSMAASDNVPDAAFISVKAVDASQYPYYGAASLEPAQTLATALRAGDVVVSEQVIEKLHVKPGDVIRIGRSPFRISAVIRVEPERFMGVLGLGMRAIVSRETFASSGLGRSGNALKNRILVKVDDSRKLAELRERLQHAVPEGNVVDYREANRVEASRQESVVSFVSITAFLVLLLGTMGIAIALRQHVDQRMDSLAMLRVLGARGDQIGKIFAVEAGMLFTAALAVGLPLAWVIRESLLGMAGRQIMLPASGGGLASLFGGAGAACLAVAPALFGPAMMVRRMRPSALLRAESTAGSTPDVPLFGALLAAVILPAAAFAATDSWLTGAVVCVAAGVFGSAAYILNEGFIRMFRAWLSRAGHRHAIMRFGVGGLTRPGYGTRLVTVALSAGLMLMVATFQTGRAVVEAVADTLPYSKDSLFLAGFENRHAAEMQHFLKGLPAVQDVLFTTRASLRLVAVNGMTLDRVGESVRRDANVGSWYLGNCRGDSANGERVEGAADLTLSDELAALLNAGAGSRLEFQSRSQRVTAVVRSVHRLSPAERFWYTFEIDCRAVERPAVFHQVEIRVAPQGMAEVRGAISSRYPTLAVVTAKEVVDTLEAMSRGGILLARLVAWYAIGAGIAILAVIIAASRLARQREIAIFSAAGARRRTLWKGYTAEFATIGLVAGITGSVLACGLTSVILSLIFHRVYAVASAWVIGAAVIMSIVATVAAGWLPTYRLLSRRPMEILRGE